MKKLIFITAAMLLLLGAPEVWGKAKIDIKAASIKRYPQEHLVVAQGKVEITYQNVKLVAEKVSLYTNTKDLIAEGNVILYQGKDYLKCDRLELNLYTKKG
ncbi:MAG TPA: LPS-assembly protein LptD, partial [Thermosulfidibacter takaii]|nr:LPS-assembly protein LptD [Thermosulfidibacter takaii]